MEDWGAFEVVSARPSDTGGLLALREEAAGWLRTRGIDPVSSGQFPAAWLDATSRGPGVYVLRHGTDVAGTVTVSWHDVLVWNDDLVLAGFIADLIVARAFAGQGLGRRLLQWAEDRVSQSGLGLVRLSCPAENVALRALFESAGYYPVAARGDPKRAAVGAVALYEKILRPVSPEQRLEAEPLAD